MSHPTQTALLPAKDDCFTTSTVPEQLSFTLDRADLPGLRGVVSKLAGPGYAEKRVTERLGLEDLADLNWRWLPVHRAEHLAARDPLDLAVDLFLLQGILPAGELERLFAADERDVLIHSGLLAIDETGSARARASLFPVVDHLIFSDHAWPSLPALLGGRFAPRSTCARDRAFMRCLRPRTPKKCWLSISIHAPFAAPASTPTSRAPPTCKLCLAISTKPHPANALT
jgi:hypothetical protein